MRARMSAPDRKRQIFLSALRFAYEFGPSQVTTGMIAQDLGITQPALYKHFPSKGDIWTAVADHLSGHIAQNIQRSTENSSDPLKQLFDLVLGHLEIVLEFPALPEFMVARDTAGDMAIIQTKIRAAMTPYLGLLLQNVQSAIQQGVFRANLNPNDATALIFGVIQSVVLRMLITRSMDHLLTDGKRLLELQLAGFTAKEENQ